MIKVFFVELAAAHRTPFTVFAIFLSFRVLWGAVIRPPPPGHAKVAQTPGRARVKEKNEQTGSRSGAREPIDRAGSLSSLTDGRAVAVTPKGERFCRHPTPVHPWKIDFTLGTCPPPPPASPCLSFYPSTRPHPACAGMLFRGPWRMFHARSAPDE